MLTRSELANLSLLIIENHTLYLVFSCLNGLVLPRPDALNQVTTALETNPVAALLGPRQCGKTTLARQIAQREPTEFFDLESPVDVRRLSAPMTTLEKLSGLVVIDEVQRRPDLSS